MQTFASAVILIYAAVLIAGGLVGWRLAGSRISFTASLVSAALLSAAYWLSYAYPSGGYLMAAAVSLALAMVFGRRFRKTQRFFPSGMMLLLSIVAVILLAGVTALSW